MPEPWFDELAELIAIPSVSADPEHAGDVRRAAEWVRDMVVSAGGEAQLVETSRQPLVIGEVRASSGADQAPSVLCYCHFDVQPPAPLDLWESDPFTLVERDGWLYARGITDDKGQLYMVLSAVRELASAGRLPVNVRIAFDGEEEVGGTSISDWVVAGHGAGGRMPHPRRRHDRARQAGVHGRDERADRFRHARANGIERSSFRDVRQRRPQRHPCAHPVPPGDPAQERPASRAAPRRASSSRRPRSSRTGVSSSPEPRCSPKRESRRTTSELPRSSTSAPGAEPSAEINGIHAGKPILNTTLISTAHANFTLRLAPGQDPQEIAAGRTPVDRGGGAGRAPKSSSSSCRPREPGSSTPISPPSSSGSDAFERALGVRPLLTRVGGTMPVLATLLDRGVPTMLTGFGLLESNVHAPNERLPAESVPLGIAAVQRAHPALGELD